MIIGDMEIRLSADIARLQSGMDSARRVVGDATASMSRAADMAKAALAGIAAGIGLGQLVQMSDAYGKFTAQLKLASLSAREYGLAYADVKRIAAQSTQGLQETGVLYARIANGTRELGTAQKQVAAITETVNLSLLVSGATASEAASAQLQLSQAFASGTLRGEEFNAVNEAAPRLMLALADGIGVPVGALKKMAEEGAITSKIMADTLPNALVRLREEAKEVQTISGAFTVLKNNLMEFVGVQANASGAVSALTGAIGFLSSNLTMIAGAVVTLTTAKLVTWLVNMGTSAYTAAVANRALAASTLEAAVVSTGAASAIAAAKLTEAQANVQVTASAAALAAARVVELRAAVLGASGAVQLAIAQNGLIPAQARAAALAEANAVALAAQAVAANVATTASLASTSAITAQAVAGGIAARAMGVLRTAMMFLGGPIGAVITLLGLAATAWMVWGDKSKEASEKATAAVEESTDEMISRLDKQIEKLRERNRLQDTEPRLKGLNELSDVDKDGLARAKGDLEAVRAGTGKWAGVSQSMRYLDEVTVLHNYETALKRVAQAQDETTHAANRGRDAKIAKWVGENGTAAQKMAYEIANLKKEFGELTPAQEAWVKAKYVDKAGAAAIKAEATAYQNLMTSIAEKIAANKLELAGYDKLLESQKATIKLDAEIGTGKNKLSAASIASARAQIAIMAQQEDMAAAQAQSLALKESVAKASAKTDDEMFDRLQAEKKALDDQTKALQQQVDTYGLTEVAVVDLAMAKAQAALDAGPATYAEMFALTEQITKLEKIRELTGKKMALELGGGSVGAAKDLLEIMTAIDEVTKSAAAGMEESFGRMGKAIGGLTTAFSGYGRAQAAIDAELAKSKKDAGGDQAKIQQANALAAQQSAQLQMRSYGDMAGAAKGFFKENTTGYRVMEGAQKTFRALEMAMALKSLATSLFATTAKTTAVVVGQSVETGAVTAGENARNLLKIPGVFMSFMSSMGPWGAAAAGVAIAAVLGTAFSGGGSGGGMSAADVQKKQGAGGVFGDDDAQSDSIAQSLKMLEEHSGNLVPINRGMLAALRSIEASMKGLTNLVVRAPGVTDGTNFGIETGQLNAGKPVDFVGRLTDKIFNVIAPGALGDKVSKALINLWGKTKQNIVDSGIQFGGSVRDLQGGKGFDQYASVDTTKSSFFGLSKNTTNAVQKAGLEGELPAQFGLLFKGVESALSEAASVLGIGADHVTKSLDALTIDVTKISLKGLKGDELTAALNAVLSKTMDDMSEAVFPDMDGFRQVGEGYTETIVRLASNYASLDQSLSSLGMTFGAAGVGSLAAREGLIAAAGGIDKFAEHASSFAENFLTDAERLAPVQKYVNEELARLGQTGIKTRDDFKAAVLGLSEGGKLATTAGAELFTGLMALESAFAAVAPSLEKTKTAAEKLSERESLIDRRDELKMRPEDLATKRRKKVDESNWDVYDEVAKLDLSNKNRVLEIQNLELAGDKLGALAARRSDEIVGLDASTAQIVKRRHALEDESAAAALVTKNRGIEIQVMELQGNKAGALAATRALEVVGLEASTVALIKNRNALQDQATAAANAVTGANTALENVKTAVERNKASLEDAYKQNVDDLKALSEQTKSQISDVKSRADAVQAVFDKLNSALASTVIQVDYFDAAQRRSAQELLARAAITTRGGGTADIKGLEDALSVIAKPSQQLFGTFEEWARDQARTGSTIAALKENAKDEINFASLTVDAINKAAGAAQAGSEANLKLLAAQHKDDMAAQDKIIEDAQTEIDLARGLNTGILSIAEALKAFGIAVQMVKDNPAPLSVEGLYESVLGRQGDVKGLEFWKKAYGESVDNAEMQDFIKAAKPELDAKREGTLAQFLRKHGVPGYATGGDFGGGLRLVGENGPEIEATGPSRIFNADQTRSLMNGGDSADLAAEIRELRLVVQAQADALGAISTNTGKTAGSTGQMAKEFNNVSSGGNVVRVKANV
ncbi:MAG TPA: tape measure protein [Telluria sp.]|jgi:tape measure domain-containing protein